MRSMPMTDYPHVPAVFIKVLSEDGTRAEILRHLQQTWNELAAVRKELCYVKFRLSRYENLEQKLPWGVATPTEAMPK
jgi:hypothetical protein